jgi:hypothetical protein
VLLYVSVLTAGCYDDQHSGSFHLLASCVQKELCTHWDSRTVDFTFRVTPLATALLHEHTNPAFALAFWTPECF